MKIDNDIVKQLNIAQYSVTERFFSRNNAVCRIHAFCHDGQQLDFVYKRYNTGGIDNETRVLDLAQRISVPRILARSSSALCLEYITGKTLLECLEEMEPLNRSFSDMLDGLVYFLQQFYAALPGCIYGDINLRNFIATKNGVFGVDLEEVKPGLIQTDIGRIAAFILTYHPADTEYKKESIRYLVDLAVARFKLEAQDIHTEKQKEFDAMKKRRNKSTEVI